MQTSNPTSPSPSPILQQPSSPEINNKQDQSNPKSYFLKQFPTYDPKELISNMELLNKVEQKIKKYYIRPELKPEFFCSYAAFAKAFPSPDIYQSYRNENLNIIDIHLRYNQYIHEKMAIYKWVPSLIVAAATKFNIVGLVFPLIYIKFFDSYFKDFMIWKYSKDKIINIRSQFVTKLSKPKNIFRRVKLFEKLKEDLAPQQGFQVPLKYIKFGETTQYVFHSTSDDGIERSCIYLTPFFENFMTFKNINKNSFKDLINHAKEMIESFKQYKKLPNKKEMPIYMNLNKLIAHKDIKQEEVYTVSKQIQMRLRRILQLWKYYSSGKIFISGLTLKDLTSLNKQYDLLTPQKYNFQTNSADFVLFYGAIFTFKTLKFIIKRAIRM